MYNKTKSWNHNSMDIFALTPAKDIPLLYLAIGCVLMTVLGGFASEFTFIVSVRQFFTILIRSMFVGVLAFFVGMHLKIPWYTKLAFAGIFGFIGIPSILLLIKKVLSSTTSFFQYMDEIFKEIEKKSKRNENKDNEDKKKNKKKK